MSRALMRWKRLPLTVLAGVLAIAIAGAAPLADPTSSPANAAGVDAAYVMAYFRESPNGSGNSNNVHLAVSKDGLKWTPLSDNLPILDPTLGTGGIRDPFIYRLQNGTWVVLATDLATSNFGAANPNIHIWTSPDLVTWSADRLLSLNGANPASYTWAPAAFWDPARQQYGITFSAVPQGGPAGVIMVSYTTDFVTTTPAVRFFDNGGVGGVIDSDVITGINGVNYLYYRGPSGGLSGARSTSLVAGSFTTYAPQVTPTGAIEAPTVVRSLTDPAVWWLWGDNFSPNNKFDLWRGSVVTGTWTAVSRADYTAPIGSKHNGIKPITQAEYDALLARYGGSTTVRLKSFNFPDRYVRHANSVARIDPLPFDPQADSQWRMVPGLANSAGVSFESVNFPGRYLRHSNFVLGLAVDDGSAGFKADATFTRVPGLAQAQWSSFRSYNFPDRYIRHSNYQLVLTTISGAAAQADATFDVSP